MPETTLSPAARGRAAADGVPRITEAGIFLGPAPLSMRRRSTATAAPVFKAIETDELAETLAVAFGWDILTDFDARHRYLQSAAKSLGQGALTQAHISLAFMWAQPA